MTVTASKYKKKPNDLYETEPWATHACIRALNKVELWELCLKVGDGLKRAAYHGGVERELRGTLAYGEV